MKIEKMTPTKRPQKNLVLSERTPVVYSEREGYLLVDMGREVAGYPDLEFDSPCEQEVLITFGEHLNEGGRVLREVGGRDFSFNIKARKGKNSFFCPLRRLAGRYFEVISDTPISAAYIGMRPVDYPVTELKKEYESDLVKRIYETSVRTLRLCMHEHYEDCPWREQALYALDSRNQRLFGYHAFRETEYPRANLLLMSKGLRPDGLLPICYPAGRDVPIPFFSLAYILEVCEYVEYTGDRTLLDEVGGVMQTIIETFTKKIDETGLIARLPYPYWNFYEWSPGSSARPDMSRKAEDPYHKDYEIILNAFYVYVVNIYNKTVGADYNTDAVKKAIHDTFYVASDGLYKLSCENGAYSQLANSFAALIGLGGDALLGKIAACEGNMIPATLSMKPFFYDALLTDKDGYSQFVLDDIKRVYKNMLDDGATSFWETELGWLDFNKAGSLCHGWSAAPVYYFSILGAIKNAE